MSWFGGSSSGGGGSNAGASVVLGDGGLAKDAASARMNEKREEKKDMYAGSGPTGDVTYAGAPQRYNIGQYHRGIDLNKMNRTPEYLEYDMKAGRDTQAKLFYNTGFCYGGGLLLGSIGGAVAGLRKSPSTLMKIRMNAMLNGASFWGSKVGNQAGVVALIYTFSKMAVEKSTISDRLGLGDSADSVMAGLSTGIIYKCMRGPRQMALFATAGAAAMGALTVLSKQVAQRMGRFSPAWRASPLSAR